MTENTLLEIIDRYADGMDPQQDIRFTEVMDIIKGSVSKMEIVGYAYTYGHMLGSQPGTRQIPIYSIPQMTDEHWNELAKTMGKGAAAQ